MIRSTRIRLILIVGAALSVAGCAALPPAGIGAEIDERTTIKSFSDSKVQEIVARLDGRNTLYVFDIDDTILRHPAGEFFGSDRWFRWQGELKAGAPGKLDCRLDVLGAAYYMAHLELTEKEPLLQLINGLQSSGRDVIALTSRSPQFRYPTERELDSNKIDFSKSMPRDFPGMPGYYTPDVSTALPTPRPASYQNGIAMAAGQHKGAMLVDLLNRIGAAGDYDFIVFFDDGKDKVEQMWQTFSKDPRVAKIFWYVPDPIHDPTDEEKNQALAAQEEMLGAYSSFKRRQECDMP